MTSEIKFIAKKDYENLITEPVSSLKYFPNWYKNFPSLKTSKCPYQVNYNNIFELNVISDNNIKKCPGIQDYLKTGYIVTSWADFIFREIDGELYVNWNENYVEESKKPIEFYRTDVFDEDIFGTKISYGGFKKIRTPWFVKTKPGISCLIIDPTWHLEKKFTVMPGIVHTDVVPIDLQWIFEWNYKIKRGMELDENNFQEQIVKRGDPILQIIPFYRKNFSEKIEYICDKEYKKLQKDINYFYKNSTVSECPYKKFRKKIGNFFR